MSYRVTAKTRALSERARRMAYLSHEARRANMVDSESDPPRWQPPSLRRIVVIIDLDSGRPQIKMMQLWKSHRIDLYRVRTPRGESKKAVGWSRVTARVRKSYQRVSA